MSKYTNNGVAQTFADGVGKSARSSNGNFWCAFDTLYSYATPIARIVEDITGEQVILVTSHSYSVTTTGKHMNALFRTTNGYERFTVPNLGVKGGLHVETTGDMHKENLEYLVKRHTSLTPKQRKLYGDTHKLNAMMYAEHFGLEAPNL